MPTPLRPTTPRLVSMLAARAKQEDGMALVVAISMMTVSLLVTLSAFGAVWGDIPLARGDRDRKQAYSAAEAGISYYTYHLDQDNTYWLKCTNVPGPGGGQPSPVKQAWDGSGSDPRSWRTIPNSSAEYTIELLPAPDETSCVQNDETTMIDPSNGTFRIRATGRAGGTKRSIVATYKRKGFLDYLYFTDLETLDPYAYASASAQASAAVDCIMYHYQGRDPDTGSRTAVRPTRTSKARSHTARRPCRCRRRTRRCRRSRCRPIASRGPRRSRSAPACLSPTPTSVPTR